MYAMVAQEGALVIKMSYPGNGQCYWDTNNCPFPQSQAYASPNTEYVTAHTRNKTQLKNVSM